MGSTWPQLSIEAHLIQSAPCALARSHGQTLRLSLVARLRSEGASIQWRIWWWRRSGATSTPQRRFSASPREPGRMKRRDGNMESGAAPSADSAEVEVEPSPPAARLSPAPGLSCRCPRPMASTKSAFCARPPGTSCTGRSPAGLDAARAQLGLGQSLGSGAMEDRRAWSCACSRRRASGGGMAATSATSPSIWASATADGTSAPRQHWCFASPSVCSAPRGCSPPLPTAKTCRHIRPAGNASIEWLRAPAQGTAKRVSSSSPASQPQRAHVPPQPRGGEGRSLTGEPQATTTWPRGRVTVCTQPSGRPDGRGERG